MGGPQPTEEELRAAYEAELARIRVGDIIAQTIVTLINVAGRRLGLGGPDAEQDRDLEQVRDAIDAVRALLPMLERDGAPELAPVRNALSQLQMEYARLAGAGSSTTSTGPTTSTREPSAPTDAPQGAPAAPEDAPAEGEDPGDRGPGPAESSGRLWVPGR
ncbi:MAG TPA: hypothetical protein VHX88_05875 [Solirubrobacteraceae bacterium]|jgi:hypothetical protein|nr:hypothetical protein [Solirubrobacteraceae bacterium]